MFFGAVTALSFIVGRYSAPEKIKIEKETATETESAKSSNDKKDQEKIETTVKRKDGTEITRIRYITKTEVIKEESKAALAVSKETKTIENRRGVVVQALIGLPLNSSILSGPVFGAAFNKQILGPINIGAFAFTDMRVGISLGLEF